MASPRGARRPCGGHPQLARRMRASPPAAWLLVWLLSSLSGVASGCAYTTRAERARTGALRASLESRTFQPRWSPSGAAYFVQGTHQRGFSVQVLHASEGLMLPLMLEAQVQHHAVPGGPLRDLRMVVGVGMCSSEPAPSPGSSPIGSSSSTG
jgi:hypothetical protein